MNFPIYGITEGGDYVRIDSPSVALIVIDKEDKTKKDVTAYTYQVAKLNPGAATQYFQMAVMGKLKELSSDDFDSKLQKTKVKIS